MIRIISTVLILFTVNYLFGNNVISLPYLTSDIVFSSKHDKLYAIIDAMDTEYGNQLIEINVSNGEVERSMFVGSQPGQIRLTTDEDYAWISFQAIPYVKRIDLNSFIIDKKVYLGPSVQNSSYERNSQILCYNFSVFEDENNKIVMGLEPGHIYTKQGIVLYRDDTIQPVRIPEASSLPACIEPVINNEYLVGHRQSSLESVFTTMKVLDDGLEMLDEFEGLIESNATLRRNYIKVRKDTLYVAEGTIIDAMEITDLEVVGTCQNDVIGDWYGFTFSEIHNAYLYPNIQNDSLYSTFYDKNTFEAYDSVFLMEYQYYQVIMITRLEVIDQYRFAIRIGKDYGAFSTLIFDVFGAGIHEPLTLEQVEVYPNPATDKICINGRPEHKEISVYDVSGRLVSISFTREIYSEIEIDKLKKGIYFLIITDMNKNSIPFTNKIIIQ